MSTNQRSKDHEVGVGRLLNFAVIYAKNSNHILRPCMKLEMQNIRLLMR